MATNTSEYKISQVILFRKNMGVKTPKEKVCFFWGQSFEDLKGLSNLKQTKRIEEKVQIVKENIKNMLFFDWVQFIAVTGSVAAGTVKEKDDIDVFIVVKNDRMWLYRAILTMKLGGKSLRRVWGKPFKDKIDTNFICEERGLQFNTESIFVLHELLFMIPVYNEGYYEKILNFNHRLLKSYCIEREKENVNKQGNFLLRVLDKVAFSLQYIYMILKKHKPNYKRLRRNNKKGRIAFFPEDFRREKVKEFKKFSKNFNRV